MFSNQLKWKSKSPTVFDQIPPTCSTSRNSIDPEWLYRDSLRVLPNV